MVFMGFGCWPCPNSERHILAVMESTDRNNDKSCPCAASRALPCKIASLVQYAASRPPRSQKRLSSTTCRSSDLWTRPSHRKECHMHEVQAKQNAYFDMWAGLWFLRVHKHLLGLVFLLQYILLLSSFYQKDDEMRECSAASSCWDYQNLWDTYSWSRRSCELLSFHLSSTPRSRSLSSSAEKPASTLAVVLRLSGVSSYIDNTQLHLGFTKTSITHLPWRLVLLRARYST